VNDSPEPLPFAGALEWSEDGLLAAIVHDAENGDLWDDLAATPELVPVYDWQTEELARRKANLMKNPASGLTWEQVQRKVRGRYGR
jgi:putative addiction module component (TIGR02574 family)